MAVSNTVTLTGGGDSDSWKESWALAICSASGLTLKCSVDGSTWYTAIAPDGDEVVSTASGILQAILVPGMDVKAEGSGTVILVPGIAEVFQN